MNARTLLAAGAALLVAIVVYFLWPRHELSAEDQIRALVAQVVLRAEKRDASGVAEVLAKDFRGGGLNRAEVQQLLLGQFFRAQAIVVLNPSLEVSVSSPTQGHFSGTFLFGRDGAQPAASRYLIEADVEKHEGRWQVHTAQWTH